MFQCTYCEQGPTITLKQSPKGLALCVGLAVFLLGGMGIALIFVAVGFYFFLGIFTIFFAVCFSIYCVVEYKNSYTLLTRESICVYWGAKGKVCLRWDECRFIGIYRYPSRFALAGLTISKHSVPRDPDGQIPEDFILPTDETIDLSYLWVKLPEETRKQILEFLKEVCGGMRG